MKDKCHAFLLTKGEKVEDQIKQLIVDSVMLYCKNIKQQEDL